jgi:hypothetical protein
MEMNILREVKRGEEDHIRGRRRDEMRRKRGRWKRKRKSEANEKTGRTKKKKEEMKDSQSWNF